LSGNEIATVPANAAWPDAGLLQTLILDGNAIDAIESAAFAPLDALQSLYVPSLYLLPPRCWRLPCLTRELSLGSDLYQTLGSPVSTASSSRLRSPRCK
jgi:hypothetical protein